MCSECQRGHLVAGFETSVSSPAVQMALQTDGYSADTEGSNNSPLQNSDEEMEDEKDPEGKFSPDLLF